MLSTGSAETYFYGIFRCCAIVFGEVSHLPLTFQGKVLEMDNCEAHRFHVPL